MISASNKEASSDGSANHAAAGNGPSPTIADELPEPLTAEQLAAEWDEERPPDAGPLANVAAAVATAALGAAGLAMSVAMGLGSPEKPEPGLWPFIISLVMIAMSAALLVFGRKKLDAEAFSGSSWQVAGGVATLVGFVLVVGVAGFEIPTLLLTFVWLRFLGKETWRMSIILSLAVTAAFYLIFVVALSVPIPHLF
ncbi:tripartite tricarboxylate transporter TctB family protein [Burkholderia sp. RS01]|uniref:tripartite tricarboxylate transporter TctB family protein n=1 Tax=unclassified Burkholderia TaxID=2613784 RepID=UPI003218A85A